MSDITTLLPTTELEAVNAMLDAIGEAPVDSLIDIEAPDAGTALRRLRVASKAVQEIGWDWNTDYNVVLTPDTAGLLTVPANTLKMIPRDLPYGVKLTLRGTKVYDNLNHTEVFTRTFKADLITALDFEDLPEAARQYAMCVAAEQFQAGVLGSPTLDRFLEQARMGALQSLQSAESEVGQYNVLTDNYTALDMFFGRQG